MFGNFCQKEPPVNDLVNLDIRTYKYLQRKLLEGLRASGAALLERYPASEHQHQLPTVLPLCLANAGAAQHRSLACEQSSPDRDLHRGMLLTQLGQAPASMEKARSVWETWG